MRNADVVIGLNYGDEGKGHITDYLVNEASTNVAVVRFNGGAQAGHTVKEGQTRHIFHHLGSGSFHRAPTILSRFFVVNPVLFLLERIEFKGRLNVYVDPECYVSTPYDVLINRLREKRAKHGSCGIGFGETIERNESGIGLKVKDLHDTEFVKERLALIRQEYYTPIFEDLDGFREDLTNEFLDGAEQRFLDDVEYFLKLTTIVTDTVAMNWFNHLVFEGAQGLRLDQYSEDFPNVTRSSTGLENVSVLLGDTDRTVKVFYVTRTYLTRHGAGPLDRQMANPGVVDTTNVHNQYQDELRFARHDYKRMAKDVAKDKKFYPDAKFTAVLTWCDALPLFEQVLDEVTYKVTQAVGTDEYLLSWGPDRSDIW